MKFFRTTTWSPFDLASLKWCAFLFGMVVGALFSDFTLWNVLVILLLAIVLAIRPCIVYFRDTEK